jgi:hypothetical protein
MNEFVEKICMQAFIEHLERLARINKQMQADAEAQTDEE